MRVPRDFGLSQASFRQIVIRNDLHAARASEEQLMAELARRNYDRDTAFAIKLALEEALVNAIKHGNRNDPGKQVLIRYHVGPDRAAIMVRDQGEGFRPEALPDPTSDRNLERPNGRGIMLIQAYMTKVRFNQTGNEVWMLKENPRRPARPPARR